MLAIDLAAWRYNPENNFYQNSSNPNYLFPRKGYLLSLVIIPASASMAGAASQTFPSPLDLKIAEI